MGDVGGGGWQPLAHQRLPSPTLAFLANRHKDQAPAVAGVTYGFPHACQPPARRRCTRLVYVHRRYGSRGF